VARPFPSLVRADAPAQAAFSEFVDREGRRGEYRLYPRPDGTVDVTGDREHAPLPDDPEAIAPADAAVDELRRVAGVHASRPRGAAPAGRSACDRPLTVDGLPLIGPVPGAPGS
jgi:glycine/D-amino acid oxidase-like deaminating enzyme